MSFCIVVARYNENVEWTKLLKTTYSRRTFDFVSKIIDKQLSRVIIYNKGKQLNNGFNEIFLNNVGREGHTYYKHICDNYDNLADYTIFLQGNPFDHSPNIISNLNNCLNANFNQDFKFLSEHMHYSSLNIECKRYRECKNIHKTWERVFGANVDDHECTFGSGAQFLVSKNKILQRPREFYQNIVNMLEYDISPLEGYDIERLHKYIFL